MSSKALAGLAILGVLATSSVGETLVPSSVYVEPQSLIAIDGARRLNLYCVGSGSPTVLLDAGSGNSIATWRHVQADVALFTRVCAYDRAGLGFSDAATRPSDLGNMADDLRRLIKAAAMPVPLVYVGHSLAGAIGLMYVATYPDDIAGAVLVEPAFAGDLDAMQAELPPDRRNAIADAFNRMLAGKRACLALAREGELSVPATTKRAPAPTRAGTPTRRTPSCAAPRRASCRFPASGRRRFRAGELHAGRRSARPQLERTRGREAFLRRQASGGPHAWRRGRGPWRPAGLSPQGRGGLAGRTRPDRRALEPRREHDRSGRLALCPDRPAAGGHRRHPARRVRCALKVAAAGASAAGVAKPRIEANRVPHVLAKADLPQLG